MTVRNVACTARLQPHSPPLPRQPSWATFIASTLPAYLRTYHDMLEEGNPAPDFTAPTDSGGSLTLSALRGKPVVLYFYPKDDTPG